MRKGDEEMAGVDGEARAGGKEYSNERAVLLFDRKTACAERGAKYIMRCLSQRCGDEVSVDKRFHGTGHRERR